MNGNVFIFCCRDWTGSSNTAEIVTCMRIESTAVPHISYQRHSLRQLEATGSRRSPGIRRMEGLPNERGGAPVSTEPASPTVHGYIRGRPAAGSPRHGTGVRSAIGRVLIFVPIARAETMRAESAATVASPPWTRTPSVDETTWGFLVIVSVRHYGERLKVEEKYMRNLLYQISLANVLQTR